MSRSSAASRCFCSAVGVITSTSFGVSAFAASAAPGAIARVLERRGHGRRVAGAAARLHVHDRRPSARTRSRPPARRATRRPRAAGRRRRTPPRPSRRRSPSRRTSSEPGAGEPRRRASRRRPRPAGRRDGTRRRPRRRSAESGASSTVVASSSSFGAACALAGRASAASRSWRVVRRRVSARCGERACPGVPCGFRPGEVRKRTSTAPGGEGGGVPDRRDPRRVARLSRAQAEQLHASRAEWPPRAAPSLSLPSRR